MNQLQEFWSEVGSTKNFTDPFYESNLSKFVNKNSKIIEYGCGYGRILNTLHNLGYQNLQGFDFAPKMIQRGNKTFPHLDLTLLSEPQRIPLLDNSVDAVILSTVLCCNPHKQDQQNIIDEIYRVLNKNGVLYFCDFMITPSEKYTPRYEAGAQQNQGDYGVYTTSEGIQVRHHSMQWLLTLLNKFELQWLEQQDDITMNGNSVRTIHLLAQKRP